MQSNSKKKKKKAPQSFLFPVLKEDKRKHMDLHPYLLASMWRKTSLWISAYLWAGAHAYEQVHVHTPMGRHTTQTHAD